MFKLGAKVRRKMPTMKVVEIYGTEVTCTWETSEGPKTHTFQQAQLEAVPQGHRSVPIRRT